MMQSIWFAKCDSHFKFSLAPNTYWNIPIILVLDPPPKIFVHFQKKRFLSFYSGETPRTPLYIILGCFVHVLLVSCRGETPRTPHSHSFIARNWCLALA